VLVQVEQLNRHSFGPLAIRRFHRAEIFALAADDDDAPASQMRNTLAALSCRTYDSAAGCRRSLAHKTRIPDF
jgi:hypothetical protein